MPGRRGPAHTRVAVCAHDRVQGRNRALGGLAQVHCAEWGLLGRGACKGEHPCVRGVAREKGAGVGVRWAGEVGGQPVGVRSHAPRLLATGQASTSQG